MDFMCVMLLWQFISRELMQSVNLNLEKLCDHVKKWDKDKTSNYGNMEICGEVFMDVTAWTERCWKDK